MQRLSQVRAVALVIVLVAAIGGSSGTAAGAGQQAQTLRVGIFGSLDEAEVGDRLAFEAMTRTTRMRVEFSSFVSPQAAVVAVTRGDVDIGLVGLHSTAQAVNQGAPLRALALAKQSNEWVFVANTSTVRDLRGKKIAYQTPGTETHAFSKVVLRRAGVTDAQLIALPGSPNRAAALLGGVVDAAWLNYVDFIRVVREKRGLRALLSARNLAPFSAVQALVVSESYLASNRRLLQRVVPAVLAGYEELYRASGRTKWLTRARSTVFKSTPSDARPVYENYRRIGFWPHIKEPVTKAQWESRMLFWLAGDIVESVPEFERFWDLSFWRAAARAAR